MKLFFKIELAARLEELQFEVTNRLTMFLCGRRPDHSRQQYFLIPELTGQNTENMQMNSARRRLRSLPSYYFERIVQDVYDEVLFFHYVFFLFCQMGFKPIWINRWIAEKL